jgi:hypothetical protein
VHGLGDSLVAPLESERGVCGVQRRRELMSDVQVLPTEIQNASQWESLH